jgi:hypothetical protein
MEEVKVVDSVTMMAVLALVLETFGVGLAMGLALGRV